LTKVGLNPLATSASVEKGDDTVELLKEEENIP